MWRRNIILSDNKNIIRNESEKYVKITTNSYILINIEISFVDDIIEMELKMSIIWVILI